MESKDTLLYCISHVLYQEIYTLLYIYIDGVKKKYIHYCIDKSILLSDQKVIINIKVNLVLRNDKELKQKQIYIDGVNGYITI